MRDINKLIEECAKDMEVWGYTLDLDNLEEQISYWIEDNDLYFTKEQEEIFIDKVLKQI